MPKPKTSPVSLKDSVLSIQTPAPKFKLPPTGGIMRPRVHRPDSEILTEIRECQKQTTPFFDSDEFKTVTEQVLSEITGDNHTITRKALNALRAASEDYLTILMQKADRVATEEGRMTILVPDLQKAVAEEQLQRDNRKVQLKLRRLQYHRAHLVEFYNKIE